MRYKFLTILLVEDELTVRHELKRFLQRYCKEVVTASNGEEGLQTFKTFLPDVVISDIKMPKMNGIDMAKKIKEYVPEQTIIFTTAHSDNRYFLEAIEMQVDGYILKPVDLELLKKKIMHIHKEIEVQKERRLYERILNDIAQMQDTMLAVYDKKKVPIFFNQKLLSFLGFDSLSDFLEQYNTLGEKFEKKEECYYPRNNETIWLEAMSHLDTKHHIVAMKESETQRLSFFQVALSELTQHEHIVVTFSEITSIVEEKRQHQHDAYTDELTQIDNRAKFNSVFEATIERSKNVQNDLSIVIIDIDNFKQINDKYGHIVGDNALKKMTTLILKQIRSTDLFFRWGGEEFILILENTSIQSTQKIAENLRTVIEKYDFGINKQLTCSFGVSARVHQDTSESLFNRADKALYKAKKHGRNRVEVEE